MHRIRVVGACAAVTLGLAALCAPGASAGIMALKLEIAGTQITGGAPITLSSSNLALSNAFWSDDCTETTLGGSLGNNNKAKDDFIPITEGTFGGGGNEGLCASSFNFVTQWMPEQTPEMTLDRKGHALLRFPRIRAVPLEDIEKPPGQKEACLASSNGIKGTFPVSETPQPLTVTFTESKMHLGAAHGQECGTGTGHTPLLSATFTFTSRGSVVEAVLFEHH